MKNNKELRTNILFSIGILLLIGVVYIGPYRWITDPFKTIKVETRCFECHNNKICHSYYLKKNSKRTKIISSYNAYCDYNGYSHEIYANRNPYYSEIMNMFINYETENKNNADSR